MRTPRDPPRSLKMITAESFVPDAVAASATVKPFFSVRVVFIRIVFSPFLLLVRDGGISKRRMVWSMLTMPGGSILCLPGDYNCFSKCVQEISII